MNPDKLRTTVFAPTGDEGGAGAGAPPGPLTQAKETITNAARETAARIKSVAGDTAERAKSEAQRFASGTKQDTARRMGAYSSAIHASARSLEQEDPNIAWATHRVADQLQNLADYVRNHDFTDLRRDAEDIARRHPVAFFGGMLIAGLVIGNLLKARPPQTEIAREPAAAEEPGSEATLDPPIAFGI